MLQGNLIVHFTMFSPCHQLIASCHGLWVELLEFISNQLCIFWHLFDTHLFLIHCWFATMAHKLCPAKQASGVNSLLENNPQTLRWMMCFYPMHIFVNKKVCEIVHNLLYTIFQRPNFYQQLMMKDLHNWQPHLPCAEALSNTKNKTLHYFTKPCPTLQ
jgi:hypothetical protein